uniref:Uncharacterized protein n=1 Tax=Cacopsylla melanoneura TaxID=428564 RepID=A0A8D8ZRB1_9HEMI
MNFYVHLIYFIFSPFRRYASMILNYSRISLWQCGMDTTFPNVKCENLVYLRYLDLKLLDRHIVPNLISRKISSRLKAIAAKFKKDFAAILTGALENSLKRYKIHVSTSFEIVLVRHNVTF